MNGKNIACVGLSAVAVMWSGFAWGQTANEGSVPQTDRGGIGEIVVTAQKRTENLQKTAAAVTAISGDQLVTKGIDDLRDAQMLVPAARFQPEGNNTQVFVRGVGSNLDFGNVEPTVGFNFSGVYMPREATSSAFFDVSSMEVLPGPQGTLYGRGAMGGTINVQFKRPGFDNDGSVVLEAGNYSLIHGTVAQDFAFSDQLALRAAVDYVHHTGYFTSGADAADDVAGRLSLLYKPSSNFSAYIWGFGATKNGTAPNTVNHSDSGFLTANPYDDLGASKITMEIAAGIPSLPFTLGTPTAEKQNYKLYAMGGEFKLDLGDDASLTYIPGYTNLKSDPFYWLGGFVAQLKSSIEMYSHELRLSARTGPIDWLGGIFYYHQRNSNLFENYFGSVTNAVIQHGVDIRRNILKGEGVFGQGTWHATDTLRFTLGGRLSHDDREANGYDPEYLAPGMSPSSPWSYKRGYSYFDWKAALEYDVAPNVMAYVSAQTAHSPGTYNSISQAGIEAGNYDGNVDVKKSRLFAISGGLKSRMFDNRLQINIEGFNYIYRNLIEQQYSAALLFNPIFNADKVQIYGFQADLRWRPTPHDDFTGNVAYTHARNTKFITPNGLDFAGLQPPYSPDWTLLGTYTHTFDLGQGTLDTSVTGRYESSWFADYAHDAGTQQRASAKLDASLTYDSGKNWTLSFWGKNLTNKINIAATAAAGFPGPATGFLEAPRTYGVRLGLKY